MAHLPHTPDDPLAHTPLHDLHVALGAKMVPFAGYSMPLHYPKGILAEHVHTRRAAGLFDVSHMGQAILAGHDAARRLERLVAADLLELGEGRLRYTQLLDADGNILDDLMAARLAPVEPSEGARPAHQGRRDAAPPAARPIERLHLVVNAAQKAADFAHVRQSLPELDLFVHEDDALLALQGPAAAAVLERHLPGVGAMPFMSMRRFEREGVAHLVSRSGYTGEDGFEIALAAGAAPAFAEQLLGEPEAAPIGLGARDTLRLEAGLCLYGHDIDTTTTPVEAALAWSIGKRRRREGGFPGDDRVRLQLAHGPARLRVGLLPEGRQPAREGTDIVTPDGMVIGKVTSGSFGPSLGRPLAMGYVEAGHAVPGTALALLVRGKPQPAIVTPLPFVPHRYHRGT